jgi:hypothetical protein
LLPCGLLAFFSGGGRVAAVEVAADAADDGSVNVDERRAWDPEPRCCFGALVARFPARTPPLFAVAKASAVGSLSRVALSLALPRASGVAAAAAAVAAAIGTIRGLSSCGAAAAIAAAAAADSAAAAWAVAAASAWRSLLRRRKERLRTSAAACFSAPCASDVAVPGPRPGETHREPPEWGVCDGEMDAGEVAVVAESRSPLGVADEVLRCSSSCTETAVGRWTKELGGEPGPDPGREWTRGDAGRDEGRDAGRDVGRDAGLDVGRDAGREAALLLGWLPECVLVWSCVGERPPDLAAASVASMAASAAAAAAESPQDAGGALGCFSRASRVAIGTRRSLRLRARSEDRNAQSSAL